MTSLPRGEPDRDFVISGRLWNRLAEAVERSDRLAVAGGLELLERQGGRVLSLRTVQSGQWVFVQVTGQPLQIGGSGSGSGSISVTGPGKYSGVMLGARPGDIDYTSGVVLSDFGDISNAQACLIVNLPELITVEIGYPSRWLDRFTGAVLGVRGKSNSDGTPVVYVCFVPFVLASPTGCPGSSTADGSGSF